MVDRSPAPPPARPQRMRDLWADSPRGPGQGQASAVLGGRAPDEQRFLAAMGQAIAAASETDLHVVVFRARGRPVSLAQWSEPVLPSGPVVQDAVERALLDTDPTLAVLRLGGDIVGFSATARTPADAESFGGALAAGMIHVRGRPDAGVAISPRLGVAVVGGAGPEAGPLAGAVAEAIEAAERTLDQTTADSPYLVHNDYIREHADRRRRIGADLPRALSEKQVTLEFQPRVPVAGPVARLDTDGVGAALEVLPCWIHPDIGQISPIELLLASEANGLLRRLGRELRADALTIARRWQTEGTLGHRRLWFDLAPAQLLDDLFVREMARIASDSPGVAIGVELADDRLLDDAVIAPALDRLDGLGVALALDRVRPATLSGARIQQLPLTQVNLAPDLVRSALSEAGSRHIIEAVCSYASERSILVNACEVTTRAQLDLMGELGVDLAQGPAVSKPLAEADVWPLLDRFDSLSTDP